MARTFASATAKVTLALGALNFAFGPGTIAAIVRRNTMDSNNQFIFNAGATNNYAIRFAGDDTLELHLNGNGNGGTTVYNSSSNWLLIASTKATGTVLPRMHSLNLSDATSSWVHENAIGTLANSSTPATRAYINANTSGSNGFLGDTHMVGVWNVVLSDTQIEALAFGLAPWFVTQPKGLWMLDQALTTQKVLDMSGGGANETALTSTTVATGSVPWNRGRGPMMVL